MADHPGHLWAVIQEWLDTFKYRPPSQNELAPKLGVSPSSLSDYKYARTMPPPEFVLRLSVEIQTPYERVLDAVLHDHGYRGKSLQQVRARVNAEAMSQPGILNPRKPSEEEQAAALGAQMAQEELAAAARRQRSRGRSARKEQDRDAEAGGA
jgi:transcriptional regulator with XRE-family HTH domain